MQRARPPKSRPVSAEPSARNTDRPDPIVDADPLSRQVGAIVTVEAVRRALRRWHQPDLGRTELATSLAAVRAALADAELPDSRLARGQALRQTLLSTLAEMRDAGYAEAAELLRRQYVSQEPFMLIANDLALSERGLFKRQSQAVDVLTELLAANEVRARPIQSQGDGPGVEVRLEAIVAPESSWLGSNLPIWVSSFVGRQAEVAGVRKLIAKHRLVTLTGIGGAGKTRLAAQVAVELVETFDDGVWFVELAPVAEPSKVAAAVAAALNVPEQPGIEIADSLAEFTKDRRVLLVLDNCEHLIEGCAQLTTHLLQRASRLRVLCTSREALGIRGEQLWLVRGLTVPTASFDVGVSPARTDVGTRMASESLQHVGRFEAIQLFVVRARAARPEFELTDANAPQVAEICARLDGLPLAIELAARHVKLLTVGEINRRLALQAPLLFTGGRALPPRQQTLQAAIDWSYALLGDDEKELFARLSVFRGGWSLSAAESVCTDEDDLGQDDSRRHVTAGELLDLMGRLVDKSLVQTQVLADEGRCHFLHVVHTYAKEKLLSTGEFEHWRRRHLAYYLDLVEEAETALTGPDQLAWINRLDLELDNIRAALELAVLGDDADEAGLRMASALWRFWRLRGYVTEGRDWLHRALRAPSRQPAGKWRAKALSGAGVLAWSQGDYGAARQMHEQSLALRRQLDDRGELASSLNNLAMVASDQGDYVTSRALFEESLVAYDAVGDKVGLAKVLGNLGVIASTENELALARRHFEDALSLFRDVGDTSGIAGTLVNLGSVTEQQGQLAESASLTRQGLELHRELGEQNGMAHALSNLGHLAVVEGDLDRAGDSLEAALEIFRQLEDRWGIASVLGRLGELYLSAGDVASARRTLEESLAIWRRLGKANYIAECLALLDRAGATVEASTMIAPQQGG